MATLKEHQAAMVDLLANGSWIPASASRLAHAMHDLLGVVMLQSAARENAADIRALFGADDATTPGLNDKAISKREKALKTYSPAKWPTPAEQRVKELENMIRQLKANNAKLRADKCELEDQVEAYRSMAIPEQAGIRKEDIQDLRGSKMLTVGDVFGTEPAGCRKSDTQVCEHTWILSSDECHLVCVGCEDVKDYK